MSYYCCSAIYTYSIVYIYIHRIYKACVNPFSWNLILKICLPQFQSHQIFHVFVLAAALVHYHGITEIAYYRLTMGDCIEEGEVAV